MSATVEVGRGRPGQLDGDQHTGGRGGHARDGQRAGGRGGRIGEGDADRTPQRGIGSLGPTGTGIGQGQGGGGRAEGHFQRAGHTVGGDGGEPLRSTKFKDSTRIVRGHHTRHIGSSVDGLLDIGRGAGTPQEDHLGPLAAGDFDRRGSGESATPIEQFGLFGFLGDGGFDFDGSRTEQRFIDLEVAQLGGIGARRFGDERLAAIDQSVSGEVCVRGDFVDGGEGRVNLKLVRLDFRLRQGTAVQTFLNQATNLVEQIVDFSQGGIGGRDHVVCPRTVFDRLLNCGNLTPQRFAGDQSGRIVLSGIDFETG